MGDEVIKINQVTSAAQAARLAPRMQACGVCIGDPGRRVPAVTMAVARAIRAALPPEIPLAVAFEDVIAMGPAEIADALHEAGAHWFEYTPVDFLKADAFDAELARVAAVPMPKIANGFFLLADDESFIADTAPYRRMQAQAGRNCSSSSCSRRWTRRAGSARPRWRGPMPSSAKCRHSSPTASPRSMRIRWWRGAAASSTSRRRTQRTPTT